MGGQDFAGAIALLEPLTAEDPDNARAWYLLGSALHGAGRFEDALGALEMAADFSAVEAQASYNAACACAGLNDPEGAFEWLGRAMEAGFQNLSLLMSDTDLAGLRKDPRFNELLPIGVPATFVEDVRVHYVIDGENQGDRFGWIGRNAGDVNKDGIADLLISAPFHGPGKNSGRIYVYSGKDGKELFRCDGKPGELLGIGIESAGDIDGDARADQLAGASGAAGGTGAAYIYSGADGRLMRSFEGEAVGDSFGRKVAGAGDQDGDGVPDVIIGAAGHDANGTDAGRAYVYSGKTGKALITLDGPGPGARFGSCVDAHAGADGRLLIIGAQDAGSNNEGKVYVYRVTDGKAELAFTIHGQKGDVNLGRMFVSAIGDVNGDGVTDVYASDWESNAGTQGAGRIYIHSGADGERLYALAGEKAGDGFGIGTCEAGDVDGDGCDDFLVGAWQNDAGAVGGGRCYLYSGRTGEILNTYTCSTYGDTFGFDTTGLGDIDGDGALDFLITSADSYVSGPQSGRIFVVSGPARAK